MSTQHTPGKWKAVALKNGWAIKAKSGCVLAGVSKFPDGAELAPQCLPNARLIAAAPDMLAALREVVFAETERLHAADNDRDYLAQQTRMATALAFARAAIAKATGAA